MAATAGTDIERQKPFILLRVMRFIWLAAAACFSVCANNSFAQGCIFIKNETDKFTKLRSVLTEPVIITAKKVKLKHAYALQKVSMQLKAEGAERSMLLSYYFTQGATVANTNNSLMVLLSNGDTTSLPCTQNIPGQQRVGMSHGTTVLTYEFGIDDMAFKKLCYANITDMRMMATINAVEFALKEGLDTFPLFRCLK